MRKILHFFAMSKGHKEAELGRLVGMIGVLEASFRGIPG